MEPDFTGYITRYGVKCTDGRTILAHAFKGNDGAQIPLVWQHLHDSPNNILGHLVLEHRNDGVHAKAFFNDTEAAQQAKALVQHKDITAMSIYANQLSQTGSNVVHGNIREGSLVLAGANPGAFIDNVSMAHGDGTQVIEDEAIIYSDSELELTHASKTVDPPKKVTTDKGAMPKPSNSPVPPAQGGDGPSVQDVINSLTDEQKQVVYALIGAASAQHSAATDDPDNTITHDQKGDGQVGHRNVFDQTKEGDKKKAGPGSTLSHSDMEEIFKSAAKCGSLKEAVESYALAHGIDSIETLFPYDQAVTDSPEWISRRMEWVASVLASTRKTPFSRIRSWTADITQEEARAKGYIRAGLKREEFFGVARRVTTPQTIYKKQKLDRDDILDITDFDVVIWLQTEMRIMLDEELARAVLVGDGRDIADTDKINPANVRPIYGDDEMYVTNLEVDLRSGATDNVTATTGADAIVDAIVMGMRNYRGSGTPVMYTTLPYLSQMLLAKDTLGRRLYATTAELASALTVSDVIPCEALEATPGLIGVIVNLQDYTIGADKGGEVSMFDFFDIDYNQFKYLMETRVSGAMTKYKGALTITEFKGSGTLLADPTAPSFNAVTGVVTIPTVSNVTYVDVADDGTEGSALSSGAQTAIAVNAQVHVRAKAAANYEFSDQADEDWIFTRTG